MLKQLQPEQIDAFLDAARGSDLIAKATGESLLEVLKRNLPKRRGPESARQVVNRRRGLLLVDRRLAS